MPPTPVPTIILSPVYGLVFTLSLDGTTLSMLVTAGSAPLAPTSAVQFATFPPPPPAPAALVYAAFTYSSTGSGNVFCSSMCMGWTWLAGFCGARGCWRVFLRVSALFVAVLLFFCFILFSAGIPSNFYRLRVCDLVDPF